VSKRSPCTTPAIPLEHALPEAVIHCRADAVPAGVVRSIGVAVEWLLDEPRNDDREFVLVAPLWVYCLLFLALPILWQPALDDEEQPGGGLPHVCPECGTPIAGKAGVRG
jgi:hypothetical protein